MEYGINRISIGVQTFHPHHLSFLGRDHKLEDISSCVALLRDMNFPNCVDKA